jgi:hypothetical protein
MQVGSAEKKLLNSPRVENISVKRVLEFRDDLDEAVEAHLSIIIKS